MQVINRFSADSFLVIRRKVQRPTGTAYLATGNDGSVDIRSPIDNTSYFLHT